MLKGKTVVLGVTGSIAAYKMANVASALVKLGCEVHVVMTKNATILSIQLHLKHSLIQNALLTHLTEIFNFMLHTFHFHKKRMLCL